jgi:hypothetical protein
MGQGFHQDGKERGLSSLRWTGYKGSAEMLRGYSMKIWGLQRWYGMKALLRWYGYKGSAETVQVAKMVRVRGLHRDGQGTRAPLIWSRYKGSIDDRG